MLEVAERAADAAAESLVALIRALAARSYCFVTPTPATHERVLARDPDRVGCTLTDILGWNLPFVRGSVDPEIEALLAAADAIEPRRDLVRSRMRASSLGPDLYLHSSFPTDARDAVFFGPDSYRFARLIRAELARVPCRSGANVVDIGTGAGVGGITAARHVVEAELILTDINPHALDLARANVDAAGLQAATRCGSILADLTGDLDLVVANPPYIADPDRRSYRDGGDRYGGALSIEMVAEVLPRLAPNGRLILYTGSAVVAGQDSLYPSLAELARHEDCALAYEEIDPDVFGEELDQPAYAEVGRIAVVSAVFTRPA